MKNQPHDTLTDRFERALVLAARLHNTQMRKGSEIPYVSHLLGVTSLVLEAGGDEDQAIAALLHDAVEDQGGYKTLAEIRSLFGDRVAGIVEACTDAFEIPKPPWRERKEQYIARLRIEGPEARLVSLADKLHNARTITVDLRKNGPATWQKFTGGKDGTLWYYRSLVDAFLETGATPMAFELERVVCEMEELAGLE